MFNNPYVTRADRLVGRNIKRRRLEQGVSKTTAMRLIGCSSAAYEALENGYHRPDVATLQALATLLNCRMSDFFSDT